MSINGGSNSKAHAVMLGSLMRELLGWSQSRLATAVCKAANRDTVTRETISRWETGKRDEAARNLPESLPRFHTYLQMHRGSMLVRAGDPDGGAAYARAALDALPAVKHSLTLRMLMTEIEGS